MKPVDVKHSIGLDRLATCNEVRSAMSFSSQSAFGLISACDESREMDSEFSGRACNLSEDNVWLEFVSEMVDSKSN